MIYARTLTLIQILALLSRCVVSQEPTAVPVPNTSLYVPLDAILGSLAPGEFLVASQVTVSDSSTELVILDNAPTPTATFTEMISPSGVSLNLVVPNLNEGEGEVGEIELDITCTLSDGSSTCEAIEDEELISGTTTLFATMTTTFTEFITPFPIVALNFGPALTASPTTPSTAPSQGKPTNTNAPKNGAVSNRSSFAAVTLITLGVVFKLM